MEDEIREIEIYKWIASEQAHRDLGQDAVLEWIKLYAPTFRECWDKNHGDINGNSCSGCAWRLSGCFE